MSGLLAYGAQVPRIVWDGQARTAALADADVYVSATYREDHLIEQTDWTLWDEFTRIRRVRFCHGDVSVAGRNQLSRRGLWAAALAEAFSCDDGKRFSVSQW